MRTGRYFSLLSLIFLIAGQVAGALPLKIIIVPMFGTETIQLQKGPYYYSEDSLDQISTLKFYLSKIKVLNKAEIVLEEKNSCHLMDASNPASLEFEIESRPDMSFDELSVSLGIDSLTNVSGAFGADLDPTNGMYWTWQSGYINFKLEGRDKKCNTRNHEFTFHLGGYLPPNNCLQSMVFPVSDSLPIRIKLDIRKFLEQTDLTEVNHIMSPGAEVVLFSGFVKNSFSLIEQ